MSASGFVSYVERNDVWIKARVYERYLSAEEPAGAVAQEMERPFDLTACDRVTATLFDGDGNQVGADYRVDAVENNCLVIHPSRDLPSGGYALETLCVKNGVHSRSFRFAIMIVETDRQARTRLCVIDGYRSASLRVTLQIVSQAEVRGRDVIDEWLALPENQGKSREDFVVEVLDLYGRAVSLREAIAIATHPDYVGVDNYVYHWQNGAYVKTDIFVKGAKGDAFTYNDFTPEQLAALKGAKGDAFTYNDLTPEQLAALKGAKGDAFTYNDFTPEQLAALKGAKGDAFTYNDFTPEQLAALKGDPSSADISLVGAVVTVTNNAGQSSSVDLSAILGEVNSVLDNINGEVI